MNAPAPSERTETARAAELKTAILLHMEINPAEDWHRLTEHYRTMLDGELEELGESPDDLTETAQQVLRSEMRNRGLDEPGAARQAAGRTAKDAPDRWVSAVDSDAGLSQPNEFEQGEDSSPRHYTWKTLLCEPETTDQAYQIREMLRRAGIDSWIEKPGSRWSVFTPRVVVAADQLEQAIEIARQPIPQDIVEQSTVEMPEYVPPKCPKCGTEDPVLESAEPTNSWLCEVCGKQWTEPAADGQEGSATARH
jgi:ribosomal protein L37AE/L43A